MNRTGRRTYISISEHLSEQKNTFFLIRAFCGGRWGAYGYGVTRILTGMGGIGCFMVSFVLVVEHVGARFTSLIGVAIEIPFAIGQGVLGLEAYFVRDWRALQILAHLPLLGKRRKYCNPS